MLKCDKGFLIFILKYNAVSFCSINAMIFLFLFLLGYLCHAVILPLILCYKEYSQMTLTFTDS